MENRVSRAARSLGIVGLIAVLPVCATACAQSDAPALEASGLRAATGADVFSAPQPREYEVTSIEIVEPEIDPGQIPLQSAGSLELSDGVITDATIVMNTVVGPSVSFTLTEPLVLRREGAIGQTVEATGTLQIGGFERHGTVVGLTPRFTDGESAEFDVRIAIPDDGILPDSRRLQAVLGGASEISAEVFLSRTG